jgi:polyisoprenoid-binding protein YceI
MKKVLLGLALAIVASIGISAFTSKNVVSNKELTSYNVLTDYSKLEWVGTKKSGYHSGAFKIKSGDVKFDGGKLAGGKFVIDMNSLSLIGEDAPKFVDHLKSDDFFGTATFSEATYEISNVEYISESDIKISGSLNLKGVSVPLSFPAVIRNADDKRFFAQAFFSLDRTLWGMKYGVPNVAKDVQVSVYLFANK